MPDKKLTIGDILVTSRPFWWFMTVVPFVAGWLAGDWHLSWPLIIGALYFSLPYNLFIYGINDILTTSRTYATHANPAWRERFCSLRPISYWVVGLCC